MVIWKGDALHDDFFDIRFDFAQRPFHVFTIKTLFLLEIGKVFTTQSNPLFW